MWRAQGCSRYAHRLVPARTLLPHKLLKCDPPRPITSQRADAPQPDGLTNITEAMAQILIADDDEGFRFLLRRMLTISGHEIREAGNGDEADTWLRTFPAEVAIVDLFMPGKEGIETIMGIRRRYPAVKIIAISGGAPKSGTSFLGMAQKLGAHRTLNKPFSADELLTVLSHLIEPSTPPTPNCGPAEMSAAASD